jgi:putative acetyltransferase
MVEVDFGGAAMLSVARETPRQDDVLALIDKSDAFAQSLYPPESRHPVGADDLAAANVRFMVARVDGRAVGCGALVLGEQGRAEIKRMFVDEAVRGTGIGMAILHALEEAARLAGVTRIQLETGVENHDALTLYRRHGYHERGPFGSYAADPLSIFMEKALPR